MRRFLSKYGFTLITVSGIILFFAVLINFLSLNALINKNQAKLIGIFTREMQVKTGLVMTVANIQADFPFSVSLADVKLDDDKGRRILSAKNVLIRADWMRILKDPDNAVSAIRYIEFDEPLIQAEVKDGKINLVEILSRKPREKVAIRWDEINLKLALHRGRAEISIIETKDGEDKALPLGLPFLFNGEFILADGNLALYPKFRIMLAGPDYNPKPENEEFPSNISAKSVFQIGGYGKLDGQIKLTGDLMLKNMEEYFPLIHKLYKPLKKWDIMPGPSNGKFEIRLNGLATDVRSFEFDFQQDISQTTIKSQMKQIPEITLNRGTVRYSYPSGNLNFSFQGKA